MLALVFEEINSEFSLATTSFAAFFALKAVIVVKGLGEDGRHIHIKVIESDTFDWSLFRRVEQLRADSSLPLIVYAPEAEDERIRLCLESMPFLHHIVSDQPQKEFVDSLVNTIKDLRSQKDFLKAVVAIEYALNTGKISEALPSIESVRSSDQDPYLTNLLLGRYYFACKEYDNALEYTEKSLEILPQSMPAAALLAASYQKLNQPMKAQEILEKFLPLAEASLDYLVLLGDIHFEQGHVEESRSLYSRAQALDPLNQNSRKGLLAISILEGDFSVKAEFITGKVLLLDLARFCNIRAIALVANSNFTLADKLYRNTAHLLSGSHEIYKIYFNQGLCHKKSGDFELAREYFLKCMDIAPGEFKRINQQISALKPLLIKKETKRK